MSSFEITKTTARETAIGCMQWRHAAWMSHERRRLVIWQNFQDCFVDEKDFDSELVARSRESIKEKRGSV